MKYILRRRFQVKEPLKVANAIEAIRNAHGGRLTAADVVKTAKPANHFLHGYFEWDDKAAAVQFRLRQATYLVRAFMVAPEEGETDFSPVRAFVCVSEPGDDPREFTSVQAAMADDEMREALLDRAREELRAWRARYKHLAEFALIFQAIDQVVS